MAHVCPGVLFHIHRISLYYEFFFFFWAYSIPLYGSFTVLSANVLVHFVARYKNTSPIIRFEYGSTRCLTLEV